MNKYDDISWHLNPAFEAGPPREDAGVHIGLYLGWIIRRQMHNPEFFPDEWVDAIRLREMSGTEALSYVDGKLTSEDMTAEGDAFTAWYYDQYVDDFQRVFGDSPVEDAPSSQVRIEAQVDRRFAEWTASGRPEPLPKKEVQGPLPETFMIQLPPQNEWAQFSEESRAVLEAELAVAEERGIKVVFGPPGGPPHEAPELERLIPSDLGLQISSVTGSHWGALPRKLLEGVGVKKNDVRVANGIGRGEDGALLVTIFGFPGVSARDLDREANILFAVPKSLIDESGDRQIDNRLVHWTLTAEWTQAWWAADGLLTMCAAPDDSQLQALIERVAGA